MKTVCPHCHQKYDVPDDYLQQDVTCQKCEKDFTVTKANSVRNAAKPIRLRRFNAMPVSIRSNGNPYGNEGDRAETTFSPCFRR